MSGRWQAHVARHVGDWKRGGTAPSRPGAATAAAAVAALATEQLAEVYRSDRRVTVRRAVACHPDAPDWVRREFVAEAIARRPGDRALPLVVGMLGSRALAGILEELSANRWIASVLLDRVADLDDPGLWWSALCSPVGPAAFAHPGLSGTPYGVDLRHRYLTAAAASPVGAAHLDRALRRHGVDEEIAAVLAANRHVLVTGVGNPLRWMSETRHGADDVFASTGDPDLVRCAIRNLGSEQLADWVPALPPDMLDDVADFHDLAVCARLAIAVVERITETRPPRTRGAQVWSGLTAHRWSSRMLPAVLDTVGPAAASAYARSGWSCTGVATNPRPDITRLVTITTETRSVTGDALLEGLLSRPEVDPVGVETIARCWPAAGRVVLSARMLRRTHRRCPALGALLDRLGESLGKREDRWELMVATSSHFNGTLDDLARFVVACTG